MAVPLKLLLATCVLVAVSAEKPQVTRTALHVARSLDPSSMETMTVRTRTGDVATLIVKRRDGRQGLPFVEIPEAKSTVSSASEDKKENVTEKKDIRVPDSVMISSEPLTTKDEKDVKPLDVSKEALKRESKTNLHLVPEPVYIQSTPLLIKGRPNSAWNKRGRNLMKIDSDGIPVITGVRMPDDESDRFVWRNARVIDGKLTPYDKTKNKHDFEIKPNEDKTKIFTQSGIEWLKMEPVKPAKEAVSGQGSEWTKVEVYPSKESFKPTDVVAVVNSPTVQEWHQAEYPQEVVQVIEEPGHNTQLPEEQRFIRDRILDYIKKINREEVLNQQFDRQSRMLTDTPKAQARVLQNPGASIYPTSLLYSPPSSQPSRVSFEEGVRTPVLQYAHPELGVQPAKVLTNPDPEEQPEIHKVQPDRREQALAYFAHDIHADRSPYAFEPGLEDEARVEDFGTNGKRSHSGGVSQRPKKTLAYFYQDQTTGNNYNEKYYGKYDSFPSYSAYQSVDVRPLWQRISDSIKEHMQTGMEKVSDLTRPVMEPLVEASHKISHNLGLQGTGNREFSVLQEKLGVAGSPSVLIPAIGLVAGGAALGLGAVAVGRYLDVDMLKRSQESGDLSFDNLSPEHKRAMQSIARSLAETPPILPKDKFRRRRAVLEPEDVMEDMLQTLEANQRVGEGAITSQGVWGNTPCAKKVFCEVMTTQSEDSILITEKKMAHYLSMIHPSMAASVGYHLDDVLTAVKKKDCSAFQCAAVTTTHVLGYPVPR